MTRFKFLNPVDFQDLQELKKAYRKLVKEYHPDLNQDRVQECTEIMQRLNAEYEEAARILSVKTDATGHGQSETGQESKDFIRTVNDLMGLPDLDIEIVGSWIWIKGSTYPSKDRLKEIGCKWSSGKKAWFWNGQAKKSRSSSRNSMDKIRSKYGTSGVIHSAGSHFTQIAA